MIKINKINIFCIINRIEFWIILFFLIRLIGITNPPLETSHNWRQSTGLMVARNFLEQDSNVLYPRVDDNNGLTGIVGMEFPIMNYLYFLIAKIFGYTHWYGRLLNLIFSSLGILFFFKIVREYLNHKIALFSSLVLIVSVWFVFSRKMMPDTFCISLAFIGLYYGIRFIKCSKYWNLFLYIFFFSIGILAKLPAGIYLVICFLALFSKEIILKNKLIICFATAIPLILSYIWYFVWNPYLSEKYGLWYNSGNDLLTGFSEITNNLDLVLKKFYFEALYSYVFFIIFIVGVFYIFKKRNKSLITIFLAFTSIFIFYIFKSGHFFYQQNYYMIPYVPIMCLIIGYLLSEINKSWIFISLMLIGTIESIINQQQDFFIKKSQLYKLELEEIANSLTEKDDLIMINGNGNPQQLYLAHRKGWVCTDSQLTDSLFLNEAFLKGCKYIFVNRKSFEGTLNNELIFENDFFLVYKAEL